MQTNRCQLTPRGNANRPAEFLCVDNGVTLVNLYGLWYNTLMTTPEVSPASADTTESVSVHEDIGYSRPFVPGEMTPGSAHQLHDVQHIGGREAARIALRPEISQQPTPEEQLEAAFRWLDRKKAEAAESEQLRQIALANNDYRKAAVHRVELKKNRDKQKEISARIGNLTAILATHNHQQE